MQILTISMVAYNTDLAVLQSAVNGVLQAAQGLSEKSEISTQLFVVDNSESDVYFGQLKTVAKDISSTDFFSVKVLQSPVNDGYGAGNNHVNHQLNSSFHLVLNPDAMLDRDALFTSVAYLSANPGAGMLTPSVYSEKGYGAHVVKAYPDCLTLALRFMGNKWLSKRLENKLAKYSCVDLDDTQVPRTGVELAGGCFLFMRTKDYLALGGFDPRYFLYFEDFDLCIRMREMGKTIDYVPQVKIQHAGGDVGRKSMKHHLYFIASAVKFFNRHGWRLW